MFWVIGSVCAILALFQDGQAQQTLQIVAAVFLVGAVVCDVIKERTRL